MPNWCRTTIHARDSKQYQDLIAELKNHNANADPSFNNLIPMPPELRLQESSSAEKVVLIYVNALAVKLIHFNQQHDTANATEIKNYLKIYKKRVANMEYTLGFDERLHAIEIISEVLRKYHGHDSRKITYDYLIDDRNLTPNTFLKIANQLSTQT